MADLPILGQDDQYLEDFGSTSVSTGTSVTAGSPANTKGTSFTELVTATEHHATGLTLYLEGGAGTADYLLDIAIGAAGAEQPIIENLLWNRASVAFSSVLPRLPITIPKGSRLSGRCQSTTASSPIVVRGQLHAPGINSLPGFSKAEGVGINTADSGGTGIDGGAVVNTKSTLVQLIAATAQTYRCLYVLPGNQNQTARVAAFFLVDIAIGAPTVEKIIIPNIGIGTNANEQVVPQIIGPFFITVPAGERLTARCQCSGTTDATQRDIDVALLGVY
jgi:hypothetical protein